MANPALPTGFGGGPITSAVMAGGLVWLCNVSRWFAESRKELKNPTREKLTIHVMTNLL